MDTPLEISLSRNDLESIALSFKEVLPHQHKALNLFDDLKNAYDSIPDYRDFSPVKLSALTLWYADVALRSAKGDKLTSYNLDLAQKIRQELGSDIARETMVETENSPLEIKTLVKILKASESNDLPHKGYSSDVLRRIDQASSRNANSIKIPYAEMYQIQKDIGIPFHDKYIVTHADISYDDIKNLRKFLDKTMDRAYHPHAIEMHR